MENLGLNISDSLEKLCKTNGKCAAELQGFLAKQIWTPADRNSLLNVLSNTILHLDCTQDIAESFRAIILEIWKRIPFKKFTWVQHQNFCICLSKVIGFSSETKRFAANYFLNTEPFYLDDPIDGEPLKKKVKKVKSTIPNDKEILLAVYRILSACPDLHSIWNWAGLLQYLKKEDINVRWLALQCVALIAGMAGSELAKFQLKYFSKDEVRVLSLKWEQSIEFSLEECKLLLNPVQKEERKKEILTHTQREVVQADLSSSVISVCSVLLPKIETAKVDDTDMEELVMVGSTQDNLYWLALAVSAAKPVLLEGPVGCGKTALVEHLAKVTGRTRAPHLIKVQLGDQTDSKALLGTYRCTDIPGEFVWQAGVLTEAVVQGHWLLLEDLDYAPMDVISVLIPLLEHGLLSIPGHGDLIRASPNFRLFATQRLLGSGSSLYKMHNSGVEILEKLWTKILVKQMSKVELEEIIKTRYPQLVSVVDRLLDIYLLLSAGRHDVLDVEMSNSVESDVGKFLTRDGRLISTRDLLKWCGRIIRDFDVTKTSTANSVFQEALDCFSASLPKKKKVPTATLR